MIDRSSSVQAFKALSDPTRIRMLRLLAANRAELCVCEFVDSLQERQYNVSRQLKILEAAGLIRGQKDGRWIYYRLAAKKDPTATSLYRLVSKLPDDEIFSADQSRFTDRMKLRSEGRCRVGIQTAGLST